MRTIAKLFGRSPFSALQAHMEKVGDCMKTAGDCLDAFVKGDSDAVEQLAPQVSKLEHKADLVKNDIRNHLPKSLFLPIDRGALLNILSLQDRLADGAEDLAVLLTFKALQLPAWMSDDFEKLRDKNFSSFELVNDIIEELDELLEYSFGGPEAEKVKQMVDQVALLEHEADLIQRSLLKSLYVHEADLTYGQFDLWQRIIAQLSAISNTGEKLANQIRTILERK